MPDQIDPSLPATVPPQFNDGLTLSADQSAAMRAQWEALGLDVAEFDKAASVPPGAPQEPGEAGGEVEVASDLKTPSLAASEAHQMAAELIRQGVPAEQVNAALAADGYDAEPEDTRTDDEKEYDRAFSPARPDAYNIDFRGRVPAGVDMATVEEANAQLGSWLAEVGFPATIGAAVIERALDTAQATARMTEPERELWTREQDAALERLTGSAEAAHEARGLAIKTLERGHPEMWRILAGSGALIDAGMVLHLAHQEQRAAFRGGAK
jgi:hypothetical protein